MNVEHPPLIGEPDPDDDVYDAHATDAWQRTYADERSWEALQEDESGHLCSVDDTVINHAQFQKRLRSIVGSGASVRVQKGLIRFLYVVVDFSRAAAEMDFRPSRMVAVARSIEVFIREFFDQNLLSHIGLVIIKDGIAHTLTELGGSPESHIKALMSQLECSGDASLQNALELVHSYLAQIPSYGHREVLIIYSALSTCDPGDIMETIQKYKRSKIRCSIIGLSAEIFICKHICHESSGSYSVAMDEAHLKELLLEHAPPPPAIAEFAVANLIRMGFPQRISEGSISICSCHKEPKIGEGYICPRCKARVCELPSECQICGLPLISPPLLARSFHHLFPVPPFEEVPVPLSKQVYSLELTRESCFACNSSFLIPGSKRNRCVSCPKCKQLFCLECDIYIHENLHNCPGCENLRPSNKHILR